MPQLLTSSPDDLRELADWLTSWVWPVDDETFRVLVGPRDWSTLVEDRGKSYVYDTGLAGSKPWAFVTLVHDEVSGVTVTTTDVLPEDTPEALASLRDAFAGQVQLLEGLLGPTTARTPGREPSASWALSSGARLAVDVGGGSCFWTLDSPEYVEVGRILRRAGQ